MQGIGDHWPRAIRKKSKGNEQEWQTAQKLKVFKQFMNFEFPIFYTQKKLVPFTRSSSIPLQRPFKRDKELNCKNSTFK